MTRNRTSRCTPHSRTATRTWLLAVAGVAALGLAPALSTAGTATAAPARSAPAHAATPRFAASGAELSLRVPGSAGAPGYRLDIQRSPLQITTVRDGHTVLRTANAAVGFTTAAGPESATNVTDARWHDGVLDLTLATTAAGDTVNYRITPSADRYRVTWSVTGSTRATQVSSHYDLASAGHWYGHGEAETPRAARTPTSRGRWTPARWRRRVRPGVVPDDRPVLVHPASAPGSGSTPGTSWTSRWARPAHGVGGFAVTGRRAYRRHRLRRDAPPRRSTATTSASPASPTKSDATPTQYATPLWNSWAQFYTNARPAAAARLRHAACTAPAWPGTPSSSTTAG